MGSKIDFTVNEYKQYTVVEVHGILDTYNAGDLKNSLFGFIEEGKVNLVIDLFDLDFMDSSAISVLISCHRKLEEVKGTISIINADDNTMDIFRLATLDSFFNILPDRAALA